MNAKQKDKRPRPVDFGDIITHLPVRNFFHELIDILSGLHSDVQIRRSPVDIRAEFNGRTICRVVPYRELIHLQVGDTTVWEVRVRDEAGYLEAVHRILETYLALAAAGSKARDRRRFRSVASL